MPCVDVSNCCCDCPSATLCWEITEKVRGAHDVTYTIEFTLTCYQVGADTFTVTITLSCDEAACEEYTLVSEFCELDITFCNHNGEPCITCPGCPFECENCLYDLPLGTEINLDFEYFVDGPGFTDEITVTDSMILTLVDLGGGDIRFQGSHLYFWAAESLYIRFCVDLRCGGEASCVCSPFPCLGFDNCYGYDTSDIKLNFEAEYGVFSDETVLCGNGICVKCSSGGSGLTCADIVPEIATCVSELPHAEFEAPWPPPLPAEAPDLVATKCAAIGGSNYIMYIHYLYAN